MSSLTVLTLNPGSGPAWDSDKEATTWIIINLWHQLQICFVHVYCEFKICAIKMVQPIWYQMRKKLCRWVRFISSDVGCNLHFDTKCAMHLIYVITTLKIMRMQLQPTTCIPHRCLESVGQLIQNQEKILPTHTHSLHLHMGKSILVSTILQCKKLQVYTGRNAGLDSLVTYATFGRTKMDV